jgi:Cell Wall Hydrolase
MAKRKTKALPELELEFLPWAIVLIVAAFVIGYALGPQFGDSVKRYRLENELTMSIPDMPIVEPLILKNVTRGAAKKINDRMPFTAQPIPAAAPFFHFGSAENLTRATDCLAATIFFEAGAEPINGQMAVVQVVLNRVRHPAYPKTVCGVVFQGHERRTGCQFSYTCDGSMARRPSDAAWQRARGIARAMLNGLVYAPVGLATHYHTDWVLPAWSAKLDKVRVERTHLFFRYLGYWGTPKAFKGRYSGMEPSFGKLGLLSTAHRTAETPKEDEATDPAQIAAEAAEVARAMPDRVSDTIAPIGDVTSNQGKNTFLIYVDPLLDPDSLNALGERACGKQAKCKVLAWADYALMPKGLPLEPQERAAIAFSYLRNRSTGLQKSLWNCALFPRANKQECLPASIAGGAGGR